MSNYQHTALHFKSVRYSLLTPTHSHTKCGTTNTQEEISIPYATSCLSPHTPTQNVQLPIHGSTYNSVRHILLKHLYSHTKFPTNNTQQYIQFNTPLPADHSHSRTKCTTANTTVHTIQYSTPCWPPHTHTKCPTTNTQHYIQYSRTLPADPSLSHTKLPTAKTQHYIQFSTPLPAEPLTLPHKMSNCQHTTIPKIPYTNSC